MTQTLAPTLRPTPRAEEAADLAAARLSPAEADLARPTLALLAEAIPGQDRAAHEPEDLAGLLLSLWRFAARRLPGEPLLRASNPRVDEDGWRSRHTAIQIVTDDMPFLLDSVMAELQRRDLHIHALVHPVLRVRRDGAGQWLGLGGDGSAESLIHIEIDRQADAATLAGLERALLSILADVRVCVADWPAMRERALALADELESGPATSLPADEVAEGVALLRWIATDNFTFLGYREYEFAGEDGAEAASIPPERGLGLLRSEELVVFEGLRDMAALPADVQAFVRRPSLLLVTKASARSTVHRAVPLDAIGVKRVSPDGRVTGLRLFVGLFTSQVYIRSAREIPLVRRTIAEIVARAALDPKSHSGKSLLHILETYNRDELFQLSADELLPIALGVVQLQERPRVGLFLRRDPFERSVSALVYVPREMYDTRLRLAMASVLERAFQGEVTSFFTTLDTERLGHVLFIVRTVPGQVPAVDVAAIEAELQEVAQRWPDRLARALVDEFGEARGASLARLYREAFPQVYQERYSVAAAVIDVGRLELVVSTGAPTQSLTRPVEAPPGEVRLKLYHQGSPFPLSDLVPILEDLGLRVLSELPIQVRRAGCEPLWVHEVGALAPPMRQGEFNQVRPRFEELFARVRVGEAESDGLNRLVLLAGLDGRQVTVLRALVRYLRQARFPLSQQVIEDALAARPKIAAAILRLFEAELDPTLAGDRSLAVRGAIQEIDHLLDAVDSVEEDRALRSLAALVRAVWRTNHWQTGADGRPKPYLSLKLDSGRVPDLPAPRPMAEIWVYAPRMEGIHLRGGRIARGGIRWSDRREDFRTEILDLMKAQTVKNTVIVPVGAKGGFVVKRPPPATAGRDAVLAEGIACYQTLVRGLLDVTDNLVGGAVVPPPDCVRRDGDDPYLVVAADKGTATFSDIANRLSADYRFWLSDAFASGGSAGYDHKGMGITARGAWEGVKRHFRELGRDIQREPFTVVGVGDMSGDVFGNGMLLSPQIRLVAAFDHRHVFVDPEPDPARSFAERKRLFELPRSSWDEYDRAALSPGALIVPRTAKSVALTPEVRARLRLSAERVTPVELMRAILTAETDLLWFGGIGTYVKSGDESHADVGDRANDALRVNGEELRCRVIGEGANLGVTQCGRIEAARRGVRLNTDFIDNSAGVDTSDHEVNIKILLQAVVSAGDLTLKQRDELLEGMTDEVAALVLRDNYQQTQALTVLEAAGPDGLEREARLVRALERAGQLDRRLERLPDEEALADRARDGAGWTRPELAVILSHAKIALYMALLETDLPDDGDLEGELVEYFPTPLRGRFREAMARHPLRREIVTTRVTNSILNRIAPGALRQLRDDSGQDDAAVARAYLAARAVFDLRRLWGLVEGLDGRVPAAIQTELLREGQELAEHAIGWFLLHEPTPLAIGATVATYRAGIVDLIDVLDQALPHAACGALAERRRGLREAGAPPDDARRLGTTRFLLGALDVVRSARTAQVEILEAAGVHYRLGDRFGLDWLRERARALRPEDYWTRQAIEAVIDDLHGHQAALSARVLAETPHERPAEDRIAAWADAHAREAARVDTLLAELRGGVPVTLGTLTVAARRLRSLAEG